MTDRELLILAAKAAGIEIWPSDSSQDLRLFWLDDKDRRGGITRVEWNPLKYDAEAFRLAVKLGISVTHEKRNGTVFCDIVDTPFAEEANYGLDEQASTRRAIVRTAAAKGKSMP